MARMVREPERRHKIAREIEPVVAALNTPPPTASVKAALNLLGHRVGAPRLPLVPASDDEVEAIRTALERHGLLSTV
jgi:4-hydroxy-tetrahydrodipicolinate synthase